ncbi:unnamed protein product [Rhizoctonia solani]|uniref:Uncharacterized protein n=1 Tax=Rhizoctonia solani TaxID=456999 RepID=A0A8H3BZ70_9AGAM|nr:unnamed protein product [Rhizoctonia solani]CAE6470822.1 unnamed protein product [Rhizoctonia solani]
MTSPLLDPTTPAKPVILRAFVRKYEPRRTGSYLDEIHSWAQRAKVSLVKWNITQGPDTQFYAVPEFPDVHGHEHLVCCGQGATQHQAYQTAARYLQHYMNGIHVEQVRWKFGQLNSPTGPVHCAVPVVYESPGFLQADEVIGQGASHQAAREDSAQKLLELGYCRI